jgi:hypothetical protein
MLKNRHLLVRVLCLALVALAALQQFVIFKTFDLNDRLQAQIYENLWVTDQACLKGRRT